MKETLRIDRFTLNSKDNKTGFDKLEVKGTHFATWINTHFC